jgi:phospholipid/cholesterol/gamma-HCH transport system permease protein
MFFLNALLWMCTSPLKFRRVVEQISFIGVKSTVIVLLTGAFTGMVLSLQAFYALNKFGGESLLGPTVALSLIRELGPVVSALMVTGRAGSALASEIGIMRITEQIDAMEIMAVNPYRYIIVPNMVAAVIAFPVLGAFFSLIGIWGGYLVGVEILGLSAGTYFGEMSNYLDMADIRMGFYKSLSFGMIVAWICCYKGYYTEYGAKGVGKATTQAVVISSVLILIWDYFVTSVSI